MRVILFIVFAISQVISQNKYPKDYFRPPMDIPLSVVGYFGELRPNHFHSGVDFRTEKREGIPVYAAADGFVSRIKIGISGYGKCIYIDHPNGYTTVYGHLQRCAPFIQNILNTEHYDKQSYEIEMYPKPDLIPIKKGDLIAYSGNTGSSGGPHLHFEFRDTKTEKIINPLLFGFGDDVKDSKSPQVTGILVYPEGENSQVNGSQNPNYVNLSLQKDGTYLGSNIVANGNLGFSINAFDTSDLNFSKKGIYKADTFLNGVPYFSYEFDTFSFDETKHINTFIDYARYKQMKQRFQKLFVSNLYPESVIKLMKNKGIVNVALNFTLNYKIVLQDFHQNKTEINIPISYGLLPVNDAKISQKTPYFLKSHQDNSYAKNGISVFFPEDTFYDDFYLKFDVINNELFLHDDTIAVNNPFTITFDVTNISMFDRDKMFIANIDGGKPFYLSTYKTDNTFNVKTKNLGKFVLMKDETPPTITKVSFTEGENLDNSSTLKAYISDDLSGIKEYNAYLNGKWILMEYENKLNRLQHNFSDAMFQDGRNDFKLIVKDNMGNTTTFESYFTKTK